MTLVFGQQDQSDCDVCYPPCSCGLFCSNTPYCGRDMAWVGTYNDASTISGFCTCSGLNASTPITTNAVLKSYSAAAWNASRPAYSSRDAKADSTVCVWIDSDNIAATCDPGSTAIISSTAVTIYQGDDDKWYMIVDALYQEGAFNCVLGGEQVFDGSGDPMDCGTPGEGSPTFVLTVTLAQYSTSGTIAECNPPTSITIEGNPQ